MSDDDKNKRDDDFNPWDTVGSVGIGLLKTIKLLGDTIGNVADGVQKLPELLTINTTEVTHIFNATDQSIEFISKEAQWDNRTVLPQGEVSMKTSNTEGAYVPWYAPPQFADFSRRHWEIRVDDEPLMYIWQQNENVYYTHRLDSRGRPSKAYLVDGANHRGGKRRMVIRYNSEGQLKVLFLEKD